VVEVMRAELFSPEPAPDVYTFHAARELLPPELARAIVKESALARLPGLRQRGHDPGRWRLLLPYMPRFFSQLDLSRYDVVISSSHACALHARPREDAAHICYCYTPIRYVWLPDVEAGRVRGVRGTALAGFRGWLRRRDAEAARRPDAFAVISSAVRDRVARFYGRDSVVVHPPVEVDEVAATAGTRRPGEFVWVGRLVGYKRPELVVEAFRGLPYRLTMVGVGPLERALRASLPENVRLLGWLPRPELLELYRSSSGFVHVGEEDFGIALVEALAAGVPVVALARGGALDIVRPDVDGLLVQDPDVELLRRAITDLAEARWDHDALRRRAEEFSRPRFLERMKELILDVRSR
jgi:glycosyltransferase involved in cell wall biosynthesis